MRHRTRLSAATLALVTALLTGVAVLAPAASAAVARPTSTDATPLDNAHAHNDYLHQRPLLDALDQGFTSVEADVWLVDGRLCLGHDYPDCRRTLESAYLAPLEQRVAARGGSVYRGWRGPFQLLIDVKSDGPTTWPVIEQALAAHPRLMTHWSGGTRTPGAVMAVISGKRSLTQIAAAPTRWSAYDGDLTDLGKGLSPELMPMVSGDWWATFYWRGGYPIPADQRAKLQGYADQARAGGHTLRFYGTPDLTDPVTLAKRRRVWDAELAAGVRWLNSDDLPGLAAYLRAG
ncbi:hypothetical protein [Arsenicicoccus sp. oral taxon 190]|uniref:hypothetical protein n=1 Tax=Arsenicicoccus sp. oral taxon 190 TaxID=1658671 RepID=UPI00067A3026|nr:hypothetical protein [Arsenicicoccus sp. oral taxon 190]AKT51468.1 hypothetical protein ADJ73_09320 [Arsenicicoccus sp. oral taxon 190]